ncbi:T9SS type A sorting domain-containing protein [Flavobacterium sp.]|jgi:hypothetical protein|uniref:T9SS type A sorting domain-containing protein n=1 Tax=Flavobacterium sp. TaxID=239 RepID=UPI0037BFC141
MKKIVVWFGILISCNSFSQITLTSFSPTSVHNRFGSSVDAFGNQMVITASNTMNMTQSKVFVFNKTSSGIVEETFFTPADGITTDSFGYDVSIYNDFIAVGSPFNDQVASNTGSIYLYRKVANTWQFFQKTTPFDGIADDYFGTEVVLYNNQIFVSSTNNETIGQPTSSNNGAVYVYNFNGVNWLFSQKLTISGSQNFGKKIKVENNLLTISSNSSSAVGNLHTFTFDGSNWNNSNNFSPPNTSIVDFDLDNNQLFILDSNSNITIYNSVLSNWNQTATLSNINYNDKMPTNFEIKNDIMLVSLNFHPLLYTDKTPVRLYKKINGDWIFQQLLYSNSNNGQDDYFGTTIAITENLILLGAPNQNYPLPYGKAYTFDTTLNVINNALDDVRIHPNPTSDLIYFSNELLDNVNYVEVFQIDGKLIKKTKLAQNTFSLKELQNGIYLIKFVTNSGINFTKKIIKR